jgi:hypothetical protein
VIACGQLAAAVAELGPVETPHVGHRPVTASPRGP